MRETRELFIFQYTRLYTLSSHQIHVFGTQNSYSLSLPFEVHVDIVCGGTRDELSQIARTSAHTRGHTARISAPTCTAQGRCFIHTSRSCTVKYGFGSQAWRREQIVAPPSNPRGLGGVRYLLLELWRRCKPSRFVVHASNPCVPRLFQLDASHLA